MKKFDQVVLCGVAAAIAVFCGRALAQEDLDMLLRDLEGGVGDMETAAVGVVEVESAGGAVEADPGVGKLRPAGAKVPVAGEEVMADPLSDTKITFSGKAKNRTGEKIKKQGQKKLVKPKTERLTPEDKPTKKRLPMKRKTGKSNAPIAPRSAQK